MTTNRINKKISNVKYFVKYTYRIYQLEKTRKILWDLFPYDIYKNIEYKDKLNEKITHYRKLRKYKKLTDKAYRQMEIISDMEGGIEEMDLREHLQSLKTSEVNED